MRMTTYNLYDGFRFEESFSGHNSLKTAMSEIAEHMRTHGMRKGSVRQMLHGEETDKCWQIAYNPVADCFAFKLMDERCHRPNRIVKECPC